VIRFSFFSMKICLSALLSLAPITETFAAPEIYPHLAKADLKSFLTGDNSPSCLAEIARYPVEGMIQWMGVGAGAGMVSGAASSPFLIKKIGLSGTKAAQLMGKAVVRASVVAAGAVAAGKGLYETFLGEWSQAEAILHGEDLSALTVKIVDELLTDMERGRLGSSREISILINSLQYQLNGLNGERALLQEIIESGLVLYNIHFRWSTSFLANGDISPADFQESRVDRCLSDGLTGDELVEDIEQQLKIFLLREVVETVN